jgi:hypothetical protein
MEEETTFSAPWGTLLKSMTALSIFVLAGIPLIGIFAGPRDNTLWILSMIVMPLSILIVAAFFTIRGFVLTRDALLVKRLGWNSKLGLTDLASAEVDSEAMSRSIRTFGNGGLFCFAGAFRNKRLGSFRAFATDPHRSVILKFPHRTVVVTPDSPDEFVAKIKKLKDL